jgi:hypothetical protein
MLDLVVCFPLGFVVVIKESHGVWVVCGWCLGVVTLRTVLEDDELRTMLCIVDYVIPVAKQSQWQKYIQPGTIHTCQLQLAHTVNLLALQARIFHTIPSILQSP